MQAMVQTGLAFTRYQYDGNGMSGFHIGGPDHGQTHRHGDV